ncbi:MAG: ATP-dependent helicase, partial [Massilia sp.]
MTAADLRTAFAALGREEKLILAMLAMAGEPMGRARLHEHMAAANLRDDDDLLAHDLARMHALDLVTSSIGRGWCVQAELVWPALKAALDEGVFGDMALAYQHLTPMRRNWEGYAILRSYRQGVALLRIALIGGGTPSDIGPILAACLSCHEAGYLHPLVDICARPFEPELFARIHPQMRDEVLTVLMENVQREPASAPLLRSYAEKHLHSAASSMALRAVMTEHLILCGRLDDANSLLDHLDESLGLFYAAVLLLLRDELDGAVERFEVALKALRRETGKRKMAFPGLGGHLYVLALLRSSNPKHHKAAETYLDTTTRAVQNHDTAVYQQLSMLRQVRSGTLDPAVLPTRNWEAAMQPFL